MDFDDQVKDELQDRTKDLIEENLIESQDEKSGLEMKHKSGELDEKVERQATSKTGASWSPEQIEFLVRQRTSMDNEELREYLSGESDPRKEMRNWEPFSHSEEKYLMQNIQTQEVDAIAEHLDRDPEQVKLQLKIMGLEHLVE